VLSINDLLARRPPEPVRPAVADAPVPHARAQPAKVLVEEVYRVRQEVSRNPDVSLEPGATGTIEVHVPYDGHHHVTRTTLTDVERAAGHPSAASAEGGAGAGAPVAEVQIGHLLVADHEDTDLATTTGQAGRTMALPLRIPVRSAEFVHEDPLVSDRYRFRREITYHPRPGRPELVPVQLHVLVDDPGSVSVPRIEDAVVKSQQYMTFRTYLELRIQVQVDVPGRKGSDPPCPVVRRVNLSLPSGSGLALSSIEITVGSTSVGENGDSDEEGERIVVQLNPDEGGLEWFDIPTELVKGQKSDGPRTFLSPWMRARIHQPGELFSEPELLVRADVETTGVLLSGAVVRLFDARGQGVRGPRGPLTVRSSVAARATVVLDDAFAQRTFTPQQSFHFDEVIPGPARVQDILSALTDLRFEVTSRPAPKQKQSKSQVLIEQINARRGEDQDAIELTMFVLGRQQRTQRQSQHPGGRRFTSKLETGELTLVIFGSAPRDSRQLVHEVNALQIQLRDRFRRMKAQR
jgi:hypothetical protein